jgi:hypothetical protein
VILLSTVSWAARPPGLDVDAELGRWEAQATALLDGPTGCWEFTGSVHLAASGYVPASRWTRPDRHDHHLRGPFTARFEGGQWRSFEYTLTPDEPSESDEDFEIPVWPLLGRSPEGGIGGGEPPPGEGGSITVGSEGVAVKAQGKAAVNTLRRVLDEIDPATATAYAQWDERLDGVKVFQDFPLQEGRGSDVITFATGIPQGGALATTLDVTFPSRVRVGEGLVKATIFDAQGHVRTQVADGVALPVLESLSMGVGAFGFTVGYEQQLRYETAKPCAAASAP